MKIDIVHPAHYRDDGSLVQSKKWYDRLGAYLPHLGPALMAGLTPDRHEVRLVDEYVEDIDFESDADVVALSGQIMQYDRCIDISKKFRARGKKVILGGYLPSMLPGEVEGLFDAIVVGEGDEAWPQILNDIELGQLKTRYKSPRPPDHQEPAGAALRSHQKRPRGCLSGSGNARLPVHLSVLFNCGGL